MKLRLLHRRLAVLMGLAGLLAFAGGAGFEPVSTILAGTALVGALFWQPSSRLSSRLEHLWVPLAALLVVRALLHVFVVSDDVVIPVVDLLLLLLSAEALRSLDAPNDGRLYALSFALLLASAAYRPGILFLIAFVSYVTLATVTLMVGHLQRQARRHGSRRVPVSRGFLFTTAGLSTVTLAVSVVVFLSFPRVSRGWSGRGETETSSIVGFADEVSLDAHGSRLYGNPRIVLRVEFPEGAPSDVSSLHWRGRSYDQFDGVRWSRSPDLNPSLAPSSWYENRWGGERTPQKIYGTPLDQRVLFALHPVLDVDAESRIHPLFDRAGDFTYWGSDQPVYTAESVTSRPPAGALRAAEGRFTPGDGAFTQLPSQLPASIRTLADSLTAQLDNRYDRTVAVRNWLTREFSYTLELPATRSEATLEHFLFERRAGHCEYFSTAMAVLLRTQGIPARNVNGFLGGQWSEFGRYLAVTQNEAHSWVEVWFPGYGWVPFDPTPSGSGSTEDSQIWFWPGRFLLDGIQHRWSKWVLDYDIGTQFDLLDRASGLFQDAAEPSTTGSDPGGQGGTPPLVWWGLGLLSLLAGGALVYGRREEERSPATRLYLRLRDGAVRAGLDGAEEMAPRALLRRIRDGWPGAAEPARTLVDDYLEVRFGGEALDGDRRSRMAGALKRARSALSGASSAGTDGSAEQTDTGGGER